MNTRTKNAKFDQIEAPRKNKFNLLTNDQQGPSDFDLLRTNCKATNSFKFIRDKKSKRIISQSSSDNEQKPKPAPKKPTAKRKPVIKKVEQPEAKLSDAKPSLEVRSEFENYELKRQKLMEDDHLLKEMTEQRENQCNKMKAMM